MDDRRTTPGIRLAPQVSQIFNNISASAQEDFCTQVIGPLMTSGYGPELIETLEQFLADNLNISQAAKHLYLHRNTMLYRLAKIHKLTGLNPRSFEQALVLKLALMAWKQRKEQAAGLSWRKKDHVG